MTTRTQPASPLIVNCPKCGKATFWNHTMITKDNQIICNTCFKPKTKGAKKHAKRS